MEIKQELEHSNYLIDVYRNLFKKKYGTFPAFEESNPQFDQMKTFKRMGAERSAAILEHYFGIEDHWFTTQAYSIQCLIKNFNRVSASLSSAMPMVSHEFKSMSVPLHCDSCDSRFLKTVELSYDFDKLALCPQCLTFFGPKLKSLDFESLNKCKREMR